MNKYQESLNFIIESSCPQKTNCKECIMEKSCNALVKPHLDNLQELVDKSIRVYDEDDIYEKALKYIRWICLINSHEDEYVEEDKKTIEKLNILQELVDKATPTKPMFEGDGYDSNGNMIYDVWICPCCGERYEVEYQKYNHCPNCGQKLDWSEE